MAVLASAERQTDLGQRESLALSIGAGIMAPPNLFPAACDSDGIPSHSSYIRSHKRPQYLLALWDFDGRWNHNVCRWIGQLYCSVTGMGASGWHSTSTR